MMADSCRSKVLEIRVRDDNPARDVEGPDRGEERSGPYLFPSEFLALLQCERVPVRWKRIFMLATCLYVRGGELEALEWNSVDLEHGYMLVHQSADADTGAIKATKTKDVRKVPIEPALRALLEKSFHDLRRTGITWRAVRGDEPLKIQRAAGHDDLRTTQRYINEAQTFEGERFGEPFPSVPLATLSHFGRSFGFSAVENARSPLFLRVDERPQRESNPR